ncbi:T9SS type A sorting domain-containing protein [Saccharicrinis sp. FJH54]|uniref:T9SS type A sorting domain-containing protein n=1 Tax=Saccharicrinis sp. FJH54 TaxID=3344665 RepID=UPI0035D3ED7E
MKNFLIAILWCITSILPAQVNLVKGEYWFDTDRSVLYPVTMTDAPEMVMFSDIDVDALFNGLHSISVRFMDDNSIWSSPFTRFFVKYMENGSAVNSAIKGYEYWFENDYDKRQYYALSGSEVFSLEENIDMSSLFQGLHIIHIRFLDSRGKWSSVVSRFVVKTAVQNPQPENEINQIEYWFDDRIEDKTVGITHQPDIYFTNQFDVSSLYEGLHSFHFRVKDKRNSYSSVVSRFFVIAALDSSLENRIVSYRYWLSDSVMYTSDLNPVGPDLAFLDSLNFRQFSKGDYIVNLQFKDSRGFWSGTVSDTISKLSYPFADLRFMNREMCLGDTLKGRVLTVDADSVMLDFGDGITDTGTVIRHLYSRDGTYNVFVQLKDTSGNITMSYPAEEAVTVHPLPGLSLMDTVVLIDEETEILDAGSGLVSYIWNGEEGTQTFEVTGDEFGLGEHYVMLKVEDINGCIQSDTIVIRVSTTESSDALSAFKLKVYPNPTVDYISVSWEDPSIQRFNVRFVDMTGKVVTGSKEINPGERIAVGHLSSGPYLMVLYINQRIISVPIVIRN